MRGAGTEKAEVSLGKAYLESKLIGQVKYTNGVKEADIDKKRDEGKRRNVESETNIVGGEGKIKK